MGFSTLAIIGSGPGPGGLGWAWPDDTLSTGSSHVRVVANMVAAVVVDVVVVVVVDEGHATGWVMGA